MQIYLQKSCNFPKFSLIPRFAMLLSFLSSSPSSQTPETSSLQHKRWNHAGRDHVCTDESVQGQAGYPADQPAHVGAVCGVCTTLRAKRDTVLKEIKN